MFSRFGYAKNSIQKRLTTSLLLTGVLVTTILMLTPQTAFAADVLLDQTFCESKLDGVWSTDQLDPQGRSTNTCTITTAEQVKSADVLTVPAGVTLAVAETGTIDDLGTIRVFGNLLLDKGMLNVDGGKLYVDSGGFVNVGVENTGNSGGLLKLLNNGYLDANGGKVIINSGGSLEIDDSSLYFENDGNLYVNESGAIVNINSGGIIYINTNGWVGVFPGASLNIHSGGDLRVNDNGHFITNRGAQVTLDGGTINVNSNGLFQAYGGTININSGGAINVNDGAIVFEEDTISITPEPVEVHVNSGGAININGGGVEDKNVGAVYVESGGTINIHSGLFDIFSWGFLGVWAGGVFNIESGGTLRVGTDGNAYINEGATLNVKYGGTFTGRDGFVAIGENAVLVYCGGTFSYEGDNFGGYDDLVGEPTYLPCDADNDGIADEVDTQPNTFSNDFSDTGIDGATTGTITSRGGQTLSVVEAPNPQGVSINADLSGSGSPATVSACEGTINYSLQPGIELIVTCGSAKTEVIQGPVNVNFVGYDLSTAYAILETGDILTFYPDTFSFFADASSGPINIIMGENTVTVEPGETIQRLPVSIDIKPGGTPNSINIKKDMIVTVALLGSSTFSVDSVDTSSLRFGGHTLQPAIRTSLEDVNEDSFMDLVMQFKVPALDFEVSDTEGCLTGLLQDGTPLMGCDSVRILEK